VIVVATVSPQLLRSARRRGRLNRAARRSLGPKPPRAAALRLARSITKKLDRFKRDVEEILFPELDKLAVAAVVTDSADRLDAVPGHIQGKLDILALRLQTAFRDTAVVEDLELAAEDVAKFNQAQLRKVLGVSIVEADAGIAAQIDNFIAINTSRIKTLAGSQLQGLKDILERPGALGSTHTSALKKEIEQFLGTKTRARAALIARDQTLTLNAQITRNRQQNAGIREYVWTTSGDERVRDTHAELDGTVQRWDDPPVTSDDGRTNHPGEDYQCRCTAFPVLPELGTERFTP